MPIDFETFDIRTRTNYEFYEPCSNASATGAESGTGEIPDSSDFTARPRQHQLSLFARRFRLDDSHPLFHHPDAACDSWRLSGADGLSVLAIPQRQTPAQTPVR